jgi:2-polyprenyl-6-methoxyphenol hydroxylase-like FAD-dependent oxidoreductase
MVAAGRRALPMHRREPEQHVAGVTKSESERCDVAIVGAGPVGLMAALTLTELGVRVRVFERGPSTKRDPRAAIVWPRAAEALRAVGVIDRFEAASCRLRRAEFRVNGRYAGAMTLGGLACAHPFPLMIEQHETERLLAARLRERGVSVAWQREVVDVRLAPDGVTLDVRGDDGARERVEAAWVIGCEGSRSLVRARAGIAFEGAPRAGLECLQVNATARWSLPDDRSTGYFFVVPGRTLLACPLPSGGYRFVSFSTGVGAPRNDPPTLEEAREAVALATLDSAVTLTAVEPAWLNRARFQDRVAASLVEGRALLAGDAAHVWAPIGGHGMNAGLRGAHNLAWKLAAVIRGESPARLLDTYSHEQRAAARAVIDGITRMKTEAPSPAWMVSLLGAVFPPALRAVDRAPQVERRLTELDASHRDSPLSCALTPCDALWPGDRVPDVAVRSEGRDTTVHALLSLHRWTLLAHLDGDDDAHLATLRSLAARYRATVRVVPITASHDEARRALGPAGRVLLVRPDDHVSVVARLHDAAAVGQHLDLWLTRAGAPASRGTLHRSEAPTR